MCTASQQNCWMQACQAPQTRPCNSNKCYRCECREFFCCSKKAIEFCDYWSSYNTCPKCTTEHGFRNNMMFVPLQMDETVGFPESGMSLPIKIGRIDIPTVLQETSTQLHRQGRVGFYCGGARLCCAVLCCAVLCCAVLCCAVLCCTQPASLGAATSLHIVHAVCCIWWWLDTSFSVHVYASIWACVCLSELLVIAEDCSNHMM